MTRAPMVIIRRGAVLEAQDAINTMIARLRAPDPVAAKGMAIAERIVSDGASSPLYTGAEPGALRRQVLVATAELEPESDELPIAA